MEVNYGAMSEYCELHEDFRYWGASEGVGIDAHVKDVGPCPWCRAERAERELAEARKALVWAWQFVKLDTPEQFSEAVNAARAAAGEK